VVILTVLRFTVVNLTVLRLIAPGLTVLVLNRVLDQMKERFKKVFLGVLSKVFYFNYKSDNYQQLKELAEQ
jgi:hypothetical protein